MPAPANDNFANATVITGASGNTSISSPLNNNSATAETGEPGHKRYDPGPILPTGSNPIDGPWNSVWFQWTCPLDGYYFFSTRKASSAVPACPTFPSTVNVFTGGAVNSLTAVTLAMDQSAGDGGGTDNGASVAFWATNGTVYSIQVDTRASGNTGSFVLAWGQFWFPRLNDCDHCPPLLTGMCKIAEHEFSVLSGPQDFFVTIPEDGCYYVLYCGGVWQIRDVSGGGIEWMTVGWSPQHGVSGIYTIGGVSTTYFPPSADTSSGYPDKPTAIQASLKNRCKFTLPICMSTAGTFSFHFEDDFVYSDNLDGNPSPVLGLYKFDWATGLSLTVASIANVGYTNGVDRSGGYNYKVLLNVTNNSIFSTCGFSIQLLSTGGITAQYSYTHTGGGDTSHAPSTTNTYGSLAGGGSDSSGGWQFNTTNTDVLTATFRIFDCNGHQVADVTVTLADASAALASNPITTRCPEPSPGWGPTYWAATFQNTGVVPISNLTVTIKPEIAGGSIWSDPSNATPCNGPWPNTQYSQALGYLEPNGFANDQVTTPTLATNNVNPAGHNQPVDFIANIPVVGNMPTYTISTFFIGNAAP